MISGIKKQNENCDFISPGTKQGQCGGFYTQPEEDGTLRYTRKTSKNAFGGGQECVPPDMSDVSKCIGGDWQPSPDTTDCSFTKLSTGSTYTKTQVNKCMRINPDECKVNSLKGVWNANPAFSTDCGNGICWANDTTTPGVGYNDSGYIRCFYSFDKFTADNISDYLDAFPINGVNTDPLSIKMYKENAIQYDKLMMNLCQKIDTTSGLTNMHSPTPIGDKCREWGKLDTSIKLLDVMGNTVCANNNQSSECGCFNRLSNELYQTISRAGINPEFDSCWWKSCMDLDKFFIPSEIRPDLLAKQGKLCPSNMCQQLINADADNGDIDISDNTFIIDCSSYINMWWNAILKLYYNFKTFVNQYRPQIQYSLIGICLICVVILYFINYNNIFRQK